MKMFCTLCNKEKKKNTLAKPTGFACDHIWQLQGPWLQELHRRFVREVCGDGWGQGSPCSVGPIRRVLHEGVPGYKRNAGARRRRRCSQLKSVHFLFLNLIYLIYDVIRFINLDFGYYLSNHCRKEIMQWFFNTFKKTQRKNVHFFAYPHGEITQIFISDSLK